MSCSFVWGCTCLKSYSHIKSGYKQKQEVITGLRWIINSSLPMFYATGPISLHRRACHYNKTAQTCLVVTMLHSFLPEMLFFFLPGEEGTPLSAAQCGIFSSFFSFSFITRFTWECVNMELLRNWLLLSSSQCGLPPINLLCLQKKLKIHLGLSLQTIVWKTRSIQIELESMWYIHKQEHH